MSARSLVRTSVARLGRFATTASRRPWTVLWIPLPIAWQMAARQARVNRLEEALTLLLTIPELVGMGCIVGLVAWELWEVGKAIAQRIGHTPQQPWVFPWFARIGLWFGTGLLLTGYVLS